MSCDGGVDAFGQHQTTRLMQAQLFLELQRRHRSHLLEVMMQAGRAHMRGLRQVFDAHGLRIVALEQSSRLRRLTVVDSHSSRIARVIDLLKRDYAQPVRVEDLAQTAHMSASSLHHHFKQVTA